MKESVLDAMIAGGSAGFAVWAAIPGVPDTTKAWAAFVAFGVSFFASLASARRHDHEEEPEPD